MLKGSGAYAVTNTTYSTVNYNYAGNQLLFRLQGADMRSTSDQMLTRQGTFSQYVVQRILGVVKSGGYAVECSGGMYTGPNKTGFQIVQYMQSYFRLTEVGLYLDLYLNTLLALHIQSATPILSLTIGNGAEFMADFLVFGDIVD